MDNTNIEFYILVYITKNETFLLKIGEYLYTDDVKEKTRKSYFDNRHSQTLFDLCYYVYTKTNRLPSLKDIEFLIGNIFQDEDQKREILDIAKDVFKFEDEISWELVEEEALKFVKDRKFIEALEQSQKELENKNYEAVIEKLQKSTQVSFDSDYGIDIKNWSDVKSALSDFQDSDVVYPTGYSMLDSERVLNGGCRPKELYVVAASSGVGKSMFMANLGVNFAIAGKKVLYISFETSEKRMCARILANLIRATTTNISYNISENEDSVKSSWEQNVKEIPGELRIKEFPSGSICCNQVETFVLDLEKNTGFKPDILILDYLAIMRPNDKRISKENTYVYSGIIAVEMRALAYRFNCAVWTGAQLNRNALSGNYNKADIGADSLSESMNIQNTADFLMFLTHNKSEASERKLEGFVVKNRNGERAKMILEVLDTCQMVELKEQKR